MTALLQIPASLRQVAENVADGFDYAASMKEFIDGLIRCLQAQGGQTTDLPLPIPAALFVEEPPRLDEALHRAHLAGMAEYLAELFGPAASGLERAARLFPRGASLFRWASRTKSNHC